MAEMSPNDTGLSGRETAIVMLRTAGKSVPETAVELGVGVATVYRALRRPLVKAALTEARGESIRPHLIQAASQVERCIAFAAEIRDNPRSTDANRLRAATTILDLYFKLHEVVDVAPRLAALEAAMAEVASEDVTEDVAEAASEPESPTP